MLSLWPWPLHMYSPVPRLPLPSSCAKDAEFRDNKHPTLFTNRHLLHEHPSMSRKAPASQRYATIEIAGRRSFAKPKRTQLRITVIVKADSESSLSCLPQKKRRLLEMQNRAVLGNHAHARSDPDRTLPNPQFIQLYAIEALQPQACAPCAKRKRICCDDPVRDVIVCALTRLL